MLLFNIKNYKITLAIVLLLMSFCLSPNEVFSKADNSANLYQALSKLMGSTKENKHLLDGWNDYLLKITDYSNAEHLKVIEELSADFNGELARYGKKLKTDQRQGEIQYSSKWIDELAGQFGNDFICNNKILILQNFMIASYRRDAKRYDQDAKDIISKELILYSAYESYLENFMGYYNKLNKINQKKMNDWKEVAEKYLSTYNKSHFAVIYYGRRMRNKLRDNTLREKDIELYNYFQKTTLPLGNAPLRKIRKDIDMFVETCKMQSLKQSKH